MSPSVLPIGVLPREFASRFRAVAGFRNVLVHGYLAVDVSQVHTVLEVRLEDFLELVDHVERWMG